MPSTGPIGGPGEVPGAQPPPKVDESEGNIEEEVLQKYIAIIEMLMRTLETKYLPDLIDARNINDAAQSILKLLTYPKDKLTDTTMSEFLTGWQYLLELQEKGDLPPMAFPFLNADVDGKNPFQELFNALEKMAAIEKEDPNYRDNPEWQKLKKKIDESGGILDKIQELSVDLVGDAAIFAAFAKPRADTIYALVKQKVAEAFAIQEDAFGFLKRIQETAVFIGQKTLGG